MWISPASCHYALQIYAFSFKKTLLDHLTRDLQSIKGASGPLGIFSKLQTKPAPSSNETGNQLKNRFQSNLQMFICVY